jgi:hypothetical protein
MGLLQGCSGPGIEVLSASSAKVIHQHSNPVMAVGGQVFGFAAVGAAKAVRMKELQERLEAGVFVGRIDFWEFHGTLRYEGQERESTQGRCKPRPPPP